MKKKLLAILLVLALTLGLLPMSAVATDANDVLPETPAFTAVADGVQLEVMSYNDKGYSYYDYNDVPQSCALYTVVIPAGTENVDLTFDRNVLAYNYDGEGNWLDGWYEEFMVGDDEAAVMVDFGDENTEADGELDFIWVQSPYDADWNSTLYYAITFIYEEDIPVVTGTVDGENLKMFRQEKLAYSYFDYMTCGTVSVDVYTMVIPEGTDEVDLSANMNVLLYSYDDKGNYLAGWYTGDSYMTGSNTGTVKVDSNNDGELDYIQVQSPYDDSWNSTLFYVITFATSAELEAGKDSCAHYLDTNVTPATGYSGGDWTALGLGRSNYETEQYSYEDYLTAVRELTLSKEGVLSETRYTEYARTCLGLMGAGADPTNVCGYDLLTPLTDYDAVTAQGINGAVYALITLGGAPEAYRTEAMETVCARYAEEILSAQRSDGGWSYMAGAASADPDMTAMALTALSFAREQDGVDAAIDDGLACLVALQNEDGTFSSWGEESSETLSQIIIALCSLEIAPDCEEFAKQGKTLTQVFADYQLEDGSFCHVLEDGSNLMATEQAMQALDAASRYYSGDTALYDFSEETATRTILPFRDVHSSDWYYDAVGTAYEYEIVFGTGIYTFSPKKNITRAQLAALIYRQAGSPEVTGTLRFTDVPANSYYYDALVWATQNGILLGETSTTFGPDHNATREQVAAVLMRYAAWQGEDTSGRADLSVYPDADRVSGYAKDAMAWAVYSGLIQGTKDNGKVRLDPKGTANRAQATAILVRYAAQ